MKVTNTFPILGILVKIKIELPKMSFELPGFKRWGIKERTTFTLNQSKSQHFQRYQRAKRTNRGSALSAFHISTILPLLVCLHWQGVDTVWVYQSQRLLVSSWWMGRTQTSATCHSGVTLWIFSTCRYSWESRVMIHDADVVALNDSGLDMEEDSKRKFPC